MTVYEATKVALAKRLNLNTDRIVWPAGEDPGGWSGPEGLVCLIHEGTGVPNEYNHPDPMTWWGELEAEVSRLSGVRVFFEWVNSAVAVGYQVWDLKTV